MNEKDTAGTAADPPKSISNGASTNSLESTSAGTPEASWLLRWSALIVAMLACASVGWIVCGVASRLPPDQLPIVFQAHLPAIVGLPSAALLSIAIVSASRFLGGPLSIQIVGLRVEGATASVFLWLVTFGAIVVAIRALW